jgi:AAA+ superfamily predicted ATPase
MTRSSAWIDDNSVYLSSAIALLRLRLERYAAADEMPPREQKAGKQQAAKRVRSLPSGEALEKAANNLARHIEKMASPPAFVALSEAFGLSEFEQNILLLCAATEFDSSIHHVCASASQTTLGTLAGDGSPTFALALSIFDNPAWDALSPERPLRYWRLIEISQHGAQSLISSALHTDERIVDFIKGLNRLDDRLFPYLTRIELEPERACLPPSQQSIAEAVIRRWANDNGQPRPVIQLAGSSYESKQTIALSISATLGRQLYRIASDSLPTSVAEVELLSRLWQRESILLPVTLLIDAQNLDSPSEAHVFAARRFITRGTGLIFLAIRESWSNLARESLSLDVSKPTREEQLAAWKAVLGKAHEEFGCVLASQFNLNLDDISRIPKQNAATTKASHREIEDMLWDSCRQQVRPSMDTLARRMDIRATWNDIVLPEQERQMLHQICAQVRERSRVYQEWGFGARMNRGLGITALFTGDSGVGKTMAAEAIANELRLNLYRIDLSSVVSKYIGETEKNLGRLFDAAEDGGAILFFDEADALFGKRSEVKDSHDRYSNIEVNYLLQRMESFSGLAILATNMRGALDAAFTRRLRFILHFPFPCVADRERMWKKAFPSKTPLRNLDFTRLARFNLTGGSISNAAINAAFLAAPKAAHVNMSHVLLAIRQEMLKLDVPLRERDFLSQEDGEEEAATQHEEQLV